MRHSAWVMLVALPIAVAALSGCTSCVSGPPVTARDISTADSTAGVRGFALEIRVTDGPGGAPLEGAGVVVYYGGIEAADWSGPRVEVGPDRVIVEPLNQSGTPESRDVLRMMTGLDGTATARVPGNRMIGIVVAKDGFTEEWLPAVAAGDTGASDAITIPLYRQRLELDVDGVWGPGGASTGFATSSQYAWDPRLLTFGESDDANRGYAARITEMTLTIEWDNGLNGAGDLGIGIGSPDDGPSYFGDASTNVGSGRQSETVTLTLQELREHGILGARAIHAGAATDSGFVAPFGLPYTMHVEARFDTARAAFASCNVASSQNDNDGLGASVPGIGVWGSAVAVTAVALARRLRRHPFSRG